MALATCLMEERGRHQLDTERMRMYFIIRIITFTIYIFIYIYIYEVFIYIYIRYLRYIFSYIIYTLYYIIYSYYYITYYIFSTRLLLILFCVAIKGEPSGLGIGINSQARFLVAKKHDIEA